MALTSTGYQVDTYSIAQSFFVEQTQGIFLLGVDLFFKSTTNPDTSLPVMLELRPMNNGFPSSTVVIPGSQTSVNRSAVQFSTNASAATRFNFDEPIFLAGLKDYAIVVSTNTSYYELFASVGDTFVIGSTVERISKQQTLGSLFFSQNAATFTPAQELDLSFKLIRASFSHSTATAVLRNATLPVRTLGTNPITTTNGSPKIKVTAPGHGFQPNDKVLMNLNGGGTIAGIDSSEFNGVHVIDSADVSQFTFSVASNANSFVRGGENNVSIEKNIPYNKLYPGIQFLEPRGTGINAGYKPTSTHSRLDANFGNSAASSRYSKASQYNPVILNQDNTANTMHVVLSDRLADSASITTKTAELALSLSSNDSSLSPVIDLQRASLTLIGNRIDQQVAGGFPITYVAETNATGGSEESKHITKVVTLEDPAVGLKILIGANRPSSTDFEVYFRTANQEENIKEVGFTLLAEETTNPSDEDPLVFRDYEYLAGGQGGDLPAFTKFQVKIVMRSTNQAKAPVFEDLRIIALSV